MSDNKKRSQEEIIKEYQGLCFRAGGIQYQISVLQKDLEQLNLTMRDLNIEAAQAKSSEEGEVK